jgi:ADP-ribosylglycohydrolase
MRAAIARVLVGSGFERSLWSEGQYPDVRCVGYDVAAPRVNRAGETAAAFDLLHPSCHLTDDSILTVAVMDWLLHPGDLHVFLRTYFRRAGRPELFGQVFRQWAASDAETPCASAGNGAAMRVSPVAFAADSPDTVLRFARESAAASHSTADAIAGAEAVALGVFLARTGCTKRDIQGEVQTRFGFDLGRPIDEIRRGYCFSSACTDTVPVSFRASLESEDYEGALRRAISVGGDADTTACMAGALAGGYWGIPPRVASWVLQTLPADMRDVVLAFESRFPDAMRLEAPDNSEGRSRSRRAAGRLRE